MARRDLPRTLLAALLLLVVTLSGCVGESEPGTDEDPDRGTLPGQDDGGEPRDPIPNGTASPEDPEEPADPDGNGTDPDPDGNTTGDPQNNTTTTPAPVWPAINDAKVRPGVQISMKIGGSTYFCTTNFVYLSPATDTVYMGTAAHCVEGLDHGAEITVYTIDYKVAFKGTLAYSSWTDIGFEPEDPAVGDDSHPHDFALIEVPEAHRGKVHPATLHFGGPTALGDLSTVKMGTRVMVYGNSDLRPGLDQANWQEGIAYGTREETVDDDKGTSIITLVPGAVPGDSGSGLMDKQGRALGALSVLATGTPYGTWMQYSSIPHALAHLKAQGWDVELATWDLLPTVV